MLIFNERHCIIEYIENTASYAHTRASIDYLLIVKLITLLFL